MNGDISLSQSLGGLRIANPDEDTPSPSPPPAPLTEAEPASSLDPPSSSHSSSSATTERQQENQLLSVGLDDPSSLGSLGFNPDDFVTASNSAPQAQPHTEQPTQISQPPHRLSVSLAHQIPQQVQYSLQSATSNPARAYASPPNPAARPLSSIYNHANLSSSSATSAQGTYRYRDDAIGPAPVPNVSRSSSSRVPPVAQPGFPTRESSRRDRSYPPVQSMPIPNGVPPPRRSSRRLPGEPGPGGRAAMVPPGGSPYGIEGGPLSSSEEWKDKGAAVTIRQEVDSNGKPIQRITKKGVKDFNFGRTLGEGSYSTVLAATDRQTGREYAIKVLDKRHIIKEKKVKYVNIEKDTLNRLTEHPGIVRLYYTFQDERSLYFVLDLATGGELLGFLKKMTTFDEECTRFYGAQILDAIEYMHSRGVIHRDLKPENVLLDDQMHVKITDFGTAKILDVKKPSNGDGPFSGDPFEGVESDRAVSFVGTAEYVSPELLTDKNACKASDLWAFGCIVYQLLAGRPPFKAGNEYQTFQKIVGLEYTFPDGFPVIARDLVERLLVLDPAKRLPIEHIKNHQFFEGVKWGKGLWKQAAPRLTSFVPPPQEPIRLNAPTASAPPSNSQLRPTIPARLITELPPPSQLDIEWSPVLTKTNERILKLGNLIVTSAPGPYSEGSKTNEVETPKKFSRFFGGNTTKKRQRLVMVTSSARIVLAAAGGEEKKTKMEINLLTSGIACKSFQDSKGLTCWCIDARDKHIIFEDPKATTSDPDGSKYSSQEWLEVIERAKEMAMSQSITHSYAGISAFTDMNSGLSSPSSTTLAGESALDGVNIPRNRHLRKDHDDAESLKGRKRFSKRHSKNGLAAVF